MAPRGRRAASAVMAVAVATTLLAGCAGDGDDPAVTGSLPVAGGPVTTGPPGTVVATIPAEAPVRLPNGAAIPVGAPNPVTVVGNSFEPASIEIEAGETVTWVNGDEEPHWVLSRRPEVLDSGALEGGNSFANAFDTPGTYAYFCNVHEDMSGEVVVR